MGILTKNYLDFIIKTSDQYLKKVFTKDRYNEFLEKISFLRDGSDVKEIVKKFSDIYIDFVKQDYQNKYEYTNPKLDNFIEKKDDGIKIMWGDCLDVLKGMKSESILRPGFSAMNALTLSSAVCSLVLISLLFSN